MEHEQSEISEFDILEWIAQLSAENTRENARKRLKNAGNSALPWLLCTHNGTENSEVASLIREIVNERGIPRRGRGMIRRILASVA